MAFLGKVTIAPGVVPSLHWVRTWMGSMKAEEIKLWGQTQEPHSQDTDGLLSLFSHLDSWGLEEGYRKTNTCLVSPSLQKLCGYHSASSAAGAQVFMLLPYLQNDTHI